MATSKQWASLENRRLNGNDLVCAVFELRARVEALEAANSKPTPNPSQIRSSLVERVGIAIDSAEYDESEHRWDEARAAIHEVVEWLREQQDGDLVAAAMLKQEAER